MNQRPMAGRLCFLKCAIRLPMRALSGGLASISSKVYSRCLAAQSSLLMLRSSFNRRCFSCSSSRFGVVAWFVCTRILMRFSSSATRCCRFSRSIGPRCAGICTVPLLTGKTLVPGMAVPADCRAGRAGGAGCVPGRPLARAAIWAVSCGSVSLSVWPNSRSLMPFTLSCVISGILPQYVPIYSLLKRIDPRQPPIT